MVFKHRYLTGPGFFLVLANKRNSLLSPNHIDWFENRIPQDGCGCRVDAGGMRGWESVQLIKRNLDIILADKKQQ
jgi:hypothetical protein